MAGKKKGDLQHHNTRNEPLTDDELQALTLQHKKKYESALATKKKADADLKNVCKVLKAELGDFGLADVKDMIASETDDHFEEKIQAELERKARLARWLGLEVGAQAGLFDTSTTAPPLADRAYDEGKRAGLAGEVCKPAYDSGGEAHQKYVEGWHFGQAALASQIKKTDTKEVPLIVNADRKESSVDEFDQAAGGANADDDDRWPDETVATEPVAEEQAASEDAREPAEAL